MDAIVYDKVGKEAEKIRNTLYGIYPQATITDAAIASFDDGADDIPVKALTVGIEPVQDLHGYENPWPAGSGVNKLKPLPAKATTNNGVTFTSNGDGTYSVSGTISSGNATLNIAFDTPALIKAGEYYLSVLNNSVPSITVGFYMFAKAERVWDIVINQTNKKAKINVPSDVYGTMLQIYVASAGTVNFKLSPVLSTDDYVSAFTPYSNICPITKFDSVKVTRMGKNLALFVNGKGITTDGRINNDSTRTATVTPIKIVSGKQYKWYSSNNYACIYAVWNGDTLIRRVSGVSNNTILNTSDGTELYVCGYAGPDVTVTADTCGLFFNDEFDGFVPHQGDTYDITLPTEAGTVYGVLDVSTGELVVDRAMVDMGSLQWNYNSTYVFFTSQSLPNRKIGVLNMWSDIFKTTSGSWSGTPLQNALWGNGSNYTFYVQLPSIDKVSDFMTFVNGHQLVYELATPITYTLTPTEITTLLEQNNIWADTGNIKKLTYRADLGKYIDSHITTAVANAMNA